MKQTPEQAFETELREIGERSELAMLVVELSEALFNKRNLPPGTRHAAFRAGQICASITSRDARRLEEIERAIERAKARAKPKRRSEAA
jgi:hypothetical protein